MLKVFKVIAFLEGVSYLGLLFIGVPLKYLANNDLLVKSLGMPHGVLFMLYVVLAFLLKKEKKWNAKDFLVVLVASVLPFGTFYVDKKYLSN